VGNLGLGEQEARKHAISSGIGKQKEIKTWHKEGTSQPGEDFSLCSPSIE
jgi:hypothetical protein